MTRKPNILFICSDQHHADVAGFAGDPVVKTPTLDRLAGNGVVFENAFCQSPVCTSSRMSFLTGKDVMSCSGWNNHWPLFPEHRTLPQCFADGGYATCLVGKMHFGGRDQYHGFLHRPYGDLHHGLGHQPDPIDMYPNSGGPTHAGPSQIPESLQQEPIVTTEAAAWAREQAVRSPDQPWFLCASYCKPHAPLTCPERYLKRYLGKTPPTGPSAEDNTLDHPYVQTQRENYQTLDLSEEESDLARAAYYGAIEFLDDTIGLLLYQLARDGLLENTIIIYTCDHGEMMGHHGLWYKANWFEHAIRVPFIMTGPGIGKGERRQGLFALTDLMPTLLDLAGLAPESGLDGVSQVGALGDPTARPRDHIISEFFGLAQLTPGYKGGRKANSMRLIRTETEKYVHTLDQGDLYFDLAEDTREFNNRIDDPAAAERVEALRSQLNADFTWEGLEARLDEERERAKEFRSGLRPGTPNQYCLPDGRTFDAEKAMYDARWLQTQTVGMAGIIPQQYH
jgi:choline-sulfatase